MAKIVKIFKDPLSVLRKLIVVCRLNWLPDKEYLKLMYYAHFGKKLNLNDPKTFNEKLQWLKLYDRKPEYTRMVDKYEAKRYIAEKIGEEYSIPALGVWDDPEEIDFAALPDKFVLKTTHDSGGVVICKDKETLDIPAVRDKLRKSLERDYFYWGREWPYKNVQRRIVAENYLEDTVTGELRDYKWYCFHGVPKMMAIFCDRAKNATTVSYFNDSFQLLDLTWGYPSAKVTPEKPRSFDQMKQLAAVLSEDIPFLRVDFYEVEGKPYVGELTFFDGSGFDVLQPKEWRAWDERIGNWLTLPLNSESKEM